MASCHLLRYSSSSLIGGGRLLNALLSVMLYIAVLTNEEYITWSDSFIVLACNGNTVWLCLVKCLLHFPRWMIQHGDAVTNNLCV